jgi:dTDP-4-dehydrorhamnose reductase
MKFFLTGSTGILGSDLLQLLEANNHEVIAFSSVNINLSDNNEINKRVKGFNPDVILHCAALTNVDACEDNRAEALKINVIGTQNLAIAASRNGSRILYISSCGVYGNSKTDPYCELDATNPLNFHHYTKLLGEQRIREHNNDHLIIRPGWLFGGTVSHRKNFVEARRKEAANNPTLSSAVDKFGSPTYTYDLAKQIMFLIEKEHVGTFNAVNEGKASRYDYVNEIINLFNINTDLKGVTSDAFPRKATMPDNECLDNMNLNLTNANLMRNWKEAIKEYITTTYNI